MNILRYIVLHGVLLAVAAATLFPFALVINNSFRKNTEFYHSFFGWPETVVNAVEQLGPALEGSTEKLLVREDTGEMHSLTPREAVRFYLAEATEGYRTSWEVIRGYMVNSLFVCLTSACSVVLLGSLGAYVLSRHRFPGSKAVFYYFISALMFPGVLTLVPSFMLVKQLGLLNTYWAMVLPYTAGGLAFSLFVFKSFFDGLPEELFESARLDGAGHIQCYRHIVIPLSKPILSVVLVMMILGTWNNFLWPFIVNTEGKYHVVASGLYVLATSAFAQNFSTLFAAYVISSIPLILLFTYATKPFIQGVTSGAFKA